MYTQQLLSNLILCLQSVVFRFDIMFMWDSILLTHLKNKSIEYVYFFCLCHFKTLSRCLFFQTHQHALSYLKVTMFFWQFTLRTGSTAKASYQRKHCLTTAVKALSSLPYSLPLSPPPLIFSSSFLHFPVLVFGGSLLSLWYKAKGGCPQAPRCRQTVSGELCSGERWYCGFLLFCQFVLLAAPQSCIFHLSWDIRGTEETRKSNEEDSLAPQLHSVL